jgi:hypothetical protein
MQGQPVKERMKWIFRSVRTPYCLIKTATDGIGLLAETCTEMSFLAVLTPGANYNAHCYNWKSIEYIPLSTPSVKMCLWGCYVKGTSS